MTTIIEWITNSKYLLILYIPIIFNLTSSYNIKANKVIPQWLIVTKILTHTHTKWLYAQKTLKEAIKQKTKKWSEVLWFCEKNICEITIRKKSMMNSNSMDAAPSSGSFGQLSESDIARSLKINPQSKTPYSDSTQVRT